MALRKINFAVHEYYHLYNRGVEKKIIFLHESDFRKFQYLMYVCNSKKDIVLRDISENFDRGETVVDIGAYCLMKNHFHILVKEKFAGGITSFMRKLLTAYSMYFNKKYKRTGRLWQGVFQSSHINTNKYLKYVYSYIHLNPAKYLDPKWKERRYHDSKKLLDFVCLWKYSSLVVYLNSVNGYQMEIINPRAFPVYFQKVIDHRRELFEWLKYNTNT